MDLKCNPRHKTDGSTFYTTCRCNCGGNFQCVIKANVKDGRVLRVEPDDRYNTGKAREDAYVQTEDLYKVRLQRRPCAVGLSFHKYAQLPQRILYPLKRKAGTKRGDSVYERISWEQALDEICGKMLECREKYGPLSVISPYMPNNTMERMFSFWGGGSVSLDSARTALRMGAKAVEIIMLETLDFKSHDRILAQDEEVREAREEGIVFTPSKGIAKLSVAENGLVNRVTCKDCIQVREPDGRFNPKFNEDENCVLYATDADIVIAAIGQRSAADAYPQGLPLQVNGRVDAIAPIFKTPVSGVFAGGDLVTGPKDIITATACGNEAAESIHRWLNGLDAAEGRRAIPNSIRPRLEKHSMPPPVISANERTCGFCEVSGGYTREMVQWHSQRCLECGAMLPSALIKREQPKKTLLPWDFAEALKLWQVRQPDNGEELPPVWTDFAAVTTEPPAGIMGRNKLVLKPKNSAEKLFYTTDDE